MKERFEIMQRAAERRNEKNEDILVAAGMTPEQAEAISDLCRERHAFHKNIDRLVSSFEESDLSGLLKAVNAVKESGLPAVEGVPCDYEDIETDSIDILLELAYQGVEDIPDKDEDPDAYQEWYDDTYERLFNEWQSINDNIEKYLLDVDKKYGSHTCPSGFLRML